MEQASKLEAILNSIAEGVIVLDRKGLIISANPTAQRILADVSTDFLADILRELPSIPLTGSENELEIDQALALARLRQPRRYRVGSRVLSALTAPVKTPDGLELGTVVALRDVTREAEAEELKDGFITTVSHELRTPLTAIKGYGDLLLMTPGDSGGDEQTRFLETINRNADRLLRHINKIIDISEIQAGTLMLYKDQMCFSELVETVVETWRERMEGKGLSLNVKLSGDKLRMTGDSKRLAWAVDNLLRNAFHYTLPGGQVEIQLFRIDNEARLDVRDSGIGVAVVDQPYLFTPFFRANNEAAFDVAGVGLGLFITRSVVEWHDGRVWAESKLGSGSTFGVALPLSEN
jgi:signal transduction histidine kinase